MKEIEEWLKTSKANAKIPVDGKEAMERPMRCQNRLREGRRMVKAVLAFHQESAHGFCAACRTNWPCLTLREMTKALEK